MPNLTPVTVPAGEREGCPWDSDCECYHPEGGHAYTRPTRPRLCPLGTQAAVRWTPEVVGAPDPYPTAEVPRDERLRRR